MSKVNIMTLKDILLNYIEEASPDICNVFLSKTKLQHLNREEFLWRIEEKAENAIFIASGHVEISSIKQAGEINILGFFGPGDCLGISAVLGPGRFPASAKVISRGLDYYTVPIREIQDILMGNPTYHELMMKLQLEHDQILREKISVLSSGDMEEKLKKLIGILAMRFGVRKPDGQIIIPFVLTRNQCASFVDGRIETVIRIMSKWTKEKIIEKIDDQMVINNSQFFSL